eukprot:578743_1
MSAKSASEFASISSIVYFSLYFLLLFSLAFCVYRTQEHDSTKSFVKALWKKKGIYGQVLVHLYDTATDVGVLVQWAMYAKLESEGQNFESIDMNLLFWTSMGFVVFYRVISALIGCYSGMKESESVCSSFCDGFLGLIDMYVIKVIYGSLIDDDVEPSIKQKTIQLTEAILEALPQVVLQSVFIIRSQNDPYLSTQSSHLVSISLLASLISVANKYLFVDRDCFVYIAKDAQWSKKAPFVNKWYLLRVLWRFSFITTRFALLSLLWSVLGGAFLLIFLLISFLLWCVLIKIEMSMFIGLKLIIVYGFISLVATPAYASYLFAIGHGIEMIVTLSVITLFAFDKSIDCIICADPIDRQATSTKHVYILSFIMAGWISMMIDFITYYILLLNDKVKRIAGGMFAALMTGIEEKVFKNNTGDTLTCSCCSSAPEAFTEYEIMIEQQRVHLEIRNSIRRDTERKKLLLLGTESSGKSTLFKALKIATKDPNMETEHEKSLPIIRHNCVAGIITLLKKSQQLYDKDPDANGACLVHMDDDITTQIQLVVKYGSEAFAEDYDEQLGECIYSLWSLDAIHATFDRRGAKYSYPDNMDYFLNKVREIMSPNYAPSMEDVLKCRMRTTGMIEYKYHRKSNRFIIYDVGGQRNERIRKKWIHQFADVAAVIFVCALNHYQTVLFEDETKNAMHEAIELFTEICNSRWFTKSEMILFLNKDDLFREKIRLQIPLSVCFSHEVGWNEKEWNGIDYKGDKQQYDECYDSAIKFITDSFTSVNQFPDRVIFCHVTSATDLDNVQKVFWDVQNIVIRSNLRRGGLSLV